jgi:hypothetical protein
MDEPIRFAKFKKAHKLRMSVAQIEKPSLTTSNGHSSAKKMHETVHLPERLPLKVAWRDRLRAWGYRMVAKNDQGKYSVSQGLALVVIAAVLTFGAASYWRSQEQHDKIIRLETTIEILEKTNADRDSKIDQATNWGQSAKSDVKYLQGKFDQFALDYAVNPKEERK